MIENVWGYMVHDVYNEGRQFNSLKDLKEAIFDAWEKVPQNYLDTLVKSMKNRICEVLINKGGATHY